MSTALLVFSTAMNRKQLTVSRSPHEEGVALFDLPLLLKHAHRASQLPELDPLSLDSPSRSPLSSCD